MSECKIASDDDGKPMIADMFDNSAFDLARNEAVREGQTLRRMEEFELARLAGRYGVYYDSDCSRKAW